VLTVTLFVDRKWNLLCCQQKKCFFLTHLFLGIRTIANHSFFWLCSILRPTRTQASGCENTFAFATAIFFYQTIQCNCSACNVPPDTGLQKRATFSTLIIGLARTGNRTRANCVAGSGASHQPSTTTERMLSCIENNFGNLLFCARPCRSLPRCKKIATIDEKFHWFLLPCT
jgi:hypothetical protein